MAQAPESGAGGQRAAGSDRHRTGSASGGEFTWPHRIRRRELTRVYRILRKPYAKKPRDGEGAYRFGGRWSSPGTRLAYTAEHLSLAMIEYSVHLDPDDAPKDLVLAIAQIP